MSSCPLLTGSLLHVEEGGGEKQNLHLADGILMELENVKERCYKKTRASPIKQAAQALGTFRRESQMTTKAEINMLNGSGQKETIWLELKVQMVAKGDQAV